MGSSEQTILMDYMNDGGTVYCEGSDVAFSHQSTDFLDYFGVEFIDRGEANAIDMIRGVDGTFTASDRFDFPDGDADYLIDELAMVSGTGFLECQNNISRAVFYDEGGYRTIISSVTLGALFDGEDTNTRAVLMERYLSFLTGDENPNLWRSHDTIDFGTNYAGYESTVDFKIKNIGLNGLNISNVNITGQCFTFDGDTDYMLDVGERVTLPVTFFSETAGNYDGAITFTTNDPDEENISVELTAECISAPEIEISDDELYVELNRGQVVDRTFSITNIGLNDLEFRIETLETSEPGLVGDYRNDDGEPVVCGSGGPDTYGYIWVDSDEPAGPEFEWLDISGIGEDIGLQGFDSGEFIDLPFNFGFYGNTYDRIMVSTNGYLTFDTDPTEYMNHRIPDSQEPNNLICPFWDDLYPRDGRVYYYHDSDRQRVIIQYDKWEYYSGFGDFTLQVHLLENGVIYFYYEKINGSTTSSTVGIESAEGNDGLEIVYNSSYLRDSLAIRINAGPKWLGLDELAGALTPGSSMNLVFTFDARSIGEGTYTADMYIYNNDPANPEITVPVTMLVNIVGAKDETLPYVTELKGNYPNPFNGATSISYSLGKRTYVTLDIFNVLGRKVTRLVDEVKAAGNHSIVWRADVSSGVYFYRLTAGDYVSQEKMILLK